MQLPLGNQERCEICFDFSDSIPHKRARMWLRLRYKNIKDLVFYNVGNRFRGVRIDKNYESRPKRWIH